MNFLICFKVNVTNVGEGKFSSQLTNVKTKQAYSADKLTESEIKGIFDFCFFPAEPGHYRCYLQFNGKNIKGKWDLVFI